MLKTKQKLMATAMMLAVSMLMMTSASFAWFTISTNPEITGMTTTTTVNENLEIALAGGSGNSGAGTAYTSPAADLPAAGDSGDAYTYGNLINFKAGDAATAFAAISTTLAPVALNDASGSATGFVYPTYGLDGRVSTLTAATIETMKGGVGNVSDGDATTPVDYAYYIDFIVRSNMAGELQLVGTQDRGADATDVGLGSSFTPDSTATNKALMGSAFKLAISYVAVNTTTPSNTTLSSATIANITPTSTDSSSGVVTYTNVDTGVDLVANTEYLVRVYVYLDGATLTNDFAATAVTGALNLQFGLFTASSTTELVDTPMTGTVSQINGNDATGVETPT